MEDDAGAVVLVRHGYGVYDISRDLDGIFILDWHHDLDGGCVNRAAAFQEHAFFADVQGQTHVLGYFFAAHIAAFEKNTTVDVFAGMFSAFNHLFPPDATWQNG